MSSRNELTGVLLGILLLITIHFAVFIGWVITRFNIIESLMNSDYGTVLDFYLNFWKNLVLLQFIYVIPIVIWLRSQQRWGLMKGVMIGAGLTVILNFVLGYYYPKYYDALGFWIENATLLGFLKLQFVR